MANSREPHVSASGLPPAQGGSSWVTRWLGPRKRWMAAATAGLVATVGVHLARDGADEGSREASLAAVLARSGLRVETRSIVWLDDRAGWGETPAVFLASEGEGSMDVHAASVRLGRDGAVLDVSGLANLTRSGGASEEQLVRVGDHVVFATRAASGVEALTVLDVRGEPASLTEGWTTIQRAQNAVSNWQETGRIDGIGVIRYQFLEPANEVVLAVEGGRVRAQIDGEALTLEPGVDEPIEGSALVEVHPQEKGVPGGITWVVDTVRNLSFVGPAPIEWLENRVFAAKDWLERTRYAWFGGDDDVVIAAAAAAEMAVPTETHLTEAQRQLFDEAAAEIGFPPAPMRVVFDEAVEGEGVWVPIVDDPFVNAYPNAPAAFAQSFVRPDRERPYVRVFVTLWDPRQVQLRIMPGTREPESATGQRGSGYIPRDERTSRLLVGAFDGGFQAMHGEFGMMSDDRVYLPPKPWAATVAVMDDGRVGMGSWPAPNWSGRYFDEALANRQIPVEMVDMRQNLTSVVEDGVYNPWERWWWGAAPPGATEQTYTHRSGLCVTEEGFMAFFWGASLGPETLGQAMISARCARSMHLDMNSGHCGFEFFRPYRESPDPRDPVLPPVERLDAESEFDGELPGADGMRLRARKAVRSMQMRFPRYTARDPRDFFYLTLRPVLPGPALATGEALSTEGLPHAGWPYAFARAERAGTWVVRIDTGRAVPQPIAAERHVRPLARLASPAGGSHALVARRQTVGWSFTVESAGAEGTVLAQGELASAATTVALGVDRDGFLVYTEGPGALDALIAAGVSSALDLGAPALAFETDAGGAGPDGRARTLEGGMTLLAEEAPRAEVLWPDNEPLPYSRWGYLQGQRVRYFPSGPPRFVRPE
ncbi:MAG: hypothetical protein OHK0013_46410 [Sandaracinaceae bacterium]